MRGSILSEDEPGIFDEGELSAGLVLDEHSGRVVCLSRWGPAHLGGRIREGDHVVAIDGSAVAPSEAAERLHNYSGERVGRCCLIRIRRGSGEGEDVLRAPHTTLPGEEVPVLLEDREVVVARGRVQTAIERVRSIASEFPQGSLRGQLSDNVLKGSPGHGKNSVDTRRGASLGRACSYGPASGGVGLVLAEKTICGKTGGGVLVVARVLPGSPAWESGAFAEGDELQAVDGTSGSEAGPAELAAKLAGPPGSPCTLRVRRCIIGAPKLSPWEEHERRPGTPREVVEVTVTRAWGSHQVNSVPGAGEGLHSALAELEDSYGALEALRGSLRGRTVASLAALVSMPPPRRCMLCEKGETSGLGQGPTQRRAGSAEPPRWSRVVGEEARIARGTLRLQQRRSRACMVLPHPAETRVTMSRSLASSHRPTKCRHLAALRVARSSLYPRRITSACARSSSIALFCSREDSCTASQTPEIGSDQ